MLLAVSFCPQPMGSRFGSLRHSFYNFVPLSTCLANLSKEGVPGPTHQSPCSNFDGKEVHSIPFVNEVHREFRIDTEYLLWARCSAPFCLPKELSALLRCWYLFSWMPLLHLAFVQSPESPGDSASSLRCRLLSSNHLHSPRDLHLEFCIYSWHTEMHLLAENTSSSVGRTRERLPLNRLTPLLQPIFAILGCAAMYTDLALGLTYNLIKHAEASGPLHRAHNWNLLPFPIFAGCHERAVDHTGILSQKTAGTVTCSICCSMRLVSAGPHPTLSTVLVGLAALLLWSWHFLYPFSSLGWLTSIFGRRWPVSTCWSDSSRFHNDRLGWGLVSPRRSELLLTFLFLLGHWIFFQIWAAAWIHILYCLWSCWSLTAFLSC